MGRHKEENPSTHALKNRSYRERRSPEARELTRLRMQLRNHSMSLRDYEELRVAQSDRCGACKEPLLLEQAYQVHIDHDPRCCSREENPKIKTCGSCVRALLCKECNHAVGFFERYPQRVHMWIDYLRRVNR